MRKLNFAPGIVREYYYHEFSSDLNRYFDISGFSRDGICCILDMCEGKNTKRLQSGSPAKRERTSLTLRSLLQKNNASRPNYEYETEKNFIFSGIFYFMIAVPQTLRKEFGEEIEYAFYRCTGWPLSSAGLGGYLPPHQMLEEADLFPCDAEKENYTSMLKVVIPFMLDEFNRFFSGKESANINQQEYDKLRKAIDSKFDILMGSIESQAKEFLHNISPQK